MVNWLNLAIPFIYLGVLLGSLAVFSTFYRRRKAARAASLNSWFPPHTSRDLFFSLYILSEQDSSQLSNDNKSVPQAKSFTPTSSLLKAALLRRATETITRIVNLRTCKQPLHSLLQRGCVGEELWQSFQLAERDLEVEIRDIIHQANTLSPNWGQTIFQSANEIVNNNSVRENISELMSELPIEKEWWNQRLEKIQSQFLKEIDQS